MLRIDSGLFFATAEALEERVRDLLPLRALVLDCRGINFIDAHGAEALGTIQPLVHDRGGTLRLAHVKPQVQAVLRAAGYTGAVHGNLERAVEAERVRA